LVPEVKKAPASRQEITVDEVKRVLEVGRLLLSALTQTEIEILMQHFQKVLSNPSAGHTGTDTAHDGD
jgi:hypothetical protein